RKLSKQFKPEEITFFMMVTGFLFFTSLSIFTRQFTLNFAKPVIISALYLGILSSTVAFFLVNFMVSKVSPTISSLFSNLTTIVSVLAGSIIRNEVIRPLQILGMVMILVALFGNSFLSTKMKVQESKLVR
ncbi:membrane protein, partial [Fervidobacterium sp. SC_NGM5_G05]